MSPHISMLDYYHVAEQKAQDEINSQTDQYILGVDPDQYGSYLYDKYSLLTVRRDESREITAEHVSEWKMLPDPYTRQKTRTEVVRVRLTFPIISHEKVKNVLDILPSRRGPRLSRFEYNSHQSALVIYADVEPREVEAELKLLEWWIDARNKDIEQHNPKLKRTIDQAIQRRRQTIEQRTEEFDDLLKKVRIPLKAKPAAQSSVIDLSIRREIRPVLRPPRARQPEELVLDKDKVLAVIEIVDRTGRQFENAPFSYAKLGEEDLRSIILNHLNTIFEAGATGETFSKKGKTDIYLVIPTGGILIAECKYWTGQAHYSQTIDQLFGYLTWRHNYGICVTFSRNVGFTNILEQAEHAIRGHATFKGVLRRIAESHFESVHRFPDDDRKAVEVHHLFYDLYAG
jgi:hypothetical protein